MARHRTLVENTVVESNPKQSGLTQSLDRPQSDLAWFAAAAVSERKAKRRSLRNGLAATACSSLLIAAIAPSTTQAANGTWTGTTSGAWLTATNWTGSVIPGSTSVTSNADIATFSAALNPTIGINMNTTAGVYYLGALDNTNATARTINNSSTTAAGVLRLNGATVNAVANTIIRNTASTLLTVTNGTGSGTLGLALGNTTNVIQITSTGGITIGSNITEITAGSGLTLQGGGTGTLTLSGANSFTGVVNVNAGGTLGIQNNAALGTTAGNTVVASGATVYATSVLSALAENFTITGTGVGGIGALRFGGGGTTNLSGAVTLGGNATIVTDGGMTVNMTGGINTAGNTLTLAPTGTAFNVTTVGISGSGGAVIVSSGAVALNVASSYTGTTTVSGGALSFNSIANVGGGNSALGAPTTIANGTISIGSTTTAGSLVYTGGAQSTDRVINLAGTTGGATLDQSGTGLLQFTSALTATGAGSKTLTLQGSTAGTGEIAGAIVNNSGTNLTSVSKSGTGTWTLSGNNTYTGTTGVSGGTLIMSGTNTGSGVITVSGSTGATLTISGNHSGMSGGITLSTATGTSSSSPLLNINTSTALGTGTLLFGGGAATDVVRIDNTSAGAVNVSTANAISMNRNFTFVGTQSLNLGSGTATLGGMTTGSSRSIVVTANTLTLDGVVTETTPGTSNFGITLGGNGTLVLTNAANSFTGKVVIGNNTGNNLKLTVSSIKNFGGGASALGAPATSVLGLIQIGSGSNSSTLEFVGMTANQSSNRQIQIGSSSTGSGQAFILNNDPTYTVTFSNANFNVQATGVNGFSRSLNLGGSNTGDNTISGIISPNTGSSGTTGLVKNGTGTWVLSGTASTYTASTSVQSGILKVAAIKDFGVSSSLGAPASGLIALGNAATTGTLVYTGSGDTSNRTFRIGSNSTTPAATDTGGGVLENSGSGALTLTATTFNTQTNASSGVGADRVFTLQGSNAGNNTISGIIQDNLVSGTGTGTATVGLFKDGTGKWILAGNNTYTGATTISAGTLQIGNAGTTGSIAGTSSVTNNAALVYNRTDSLNVPYVIGGSGSLTQAGAGTLVVTNNNTYSGTTTINAGTLQIGSGGTTGSIASTSGVTNNAALVYNRSDTLNVPYVIGGTGTLTQAGAGTLVIPNTQTYTGATNVNAGTLQLDGFTDVSSTVNIATAGTLSGSGTVNGNATLTGSGIINKSGGTIAGTLGVTGGNWNGAGSVTGAVNSSSGNLNIGSGANLTANGDLNVTGGTISATNGTSTITGNVNYTSSSSSTFGGAVAGTGKAVTVNNASGVLTLGGVSTYDGATTITAGKLSVASTGTINNTSGVSIGAGEFNYNSATAMSQPVSFSGTGGTISGNGTITSSVNVTAGNFIAPGNSVGTLSTGDLTVAGTYTAEVNTGNNTADKVVVTGTVDVTGGALVLAIVPTNTILDPYNQTYVLIDNDSADAIVGEFVGLGMGTRGGVDDSQTILFPTVAATLYYSYDSVGNTTTGGNDLAIVFTSVPEPTSLSVLGLGGMGLLARRRRRSSMKKAAV